MQNKRTVLCFLVVILSIWYTPSANAQKHVFMEISRNADAILPLDDPNEGTTQSELNTSDYPRQMDSLLNKIYRTILREYQGDTTFIRTFKASQRAWLTFRDAELQSIMPPRPIEEHGSIEGLCWWEYSVSITKRRIEELLMWYQGIEGEGDACGISYRTSDEMKEMGKKKK